MKLVALDGRRFSRERLLDALAATKEAARPLDFLVENGDFFGHVRIDWRGGARHPHLERDTAKPDLLQQIIQPLVAK
jgi:hypothetical protein